ncbi:MAG: dTDP-4-dehydrorhamnose 3,5-epimerase [Gammaproteobacteria bacterium]|nr:dTDP-4-dehydrorhamnose 3,5-epimerase [Gammaproteobacteria bacterium]
MEFIETSLPGVVLIKPDVYRDPRGFFLETYNVEKYQEVIPDVFVQDNHSLSARDTLRGLHVQNPHQQGKLVRVTQGEVFDVAVDIREGSPSFGNWHGERLSADNFLQLYIPPGFAHGFCVLSETAEFLYKCTDTYHPEHELVIAWDDPDINISWPVQNPELSARDSKGLLLHDLLQQGRLPAYNA